MAVDAEQSEIDMSLKPTLLLILDGYGLAPAGPGNAVTLADTPFLKRLFSLPGATQIAASERAVGLPAGYMGNSEVGHLNIGAGRVVYQDMTRIDVAIESGELAKNAVFCQLLESIRARGGRLHLAGLLSDGGVHSHIAHIEALMGIAVSAGVPVLLQMFMDGRDTSPMSGITYVQQLEEAADKLRAAFPAVSARVASLCGRYYAMDRDKNWDRVQKAWNLLTRAEGDRAASAVAGLQASYAAGVTDEFVKPLTVGADPAENCVRDGDGIFFFNFRADRARQLARAFSDSSFAEFDRGVVPELAGIASMTSYDSSLSIPVAFTKANLGMTLGEIISRQGLRQLRIAETEKYAHVTYFFSGGREDAFPGEDRVLVNSPKDVPTYDLKPEMSIFEVTDRFVEKWNGSDYILAVCNLANPDMVGHTGVVPAVIRALEAVDACAQRLVHTVLASGGRVLVTADHGNAEELIDKNGNPQTAHTCNPVPLVVVEGGVGGELPEKAIPLASGGKLGDIVPTLLDLWGIPKPDCMTGESLVLRDDL